MFTTDASLAVRTWDRWLAAVTGISAAQARGRALRELIPDLEQRGLLARFEQVLASGVVEILAPALHGYLIPCPCGAGSKSDRMLQRVTIGPLREDDRVVGTIVAIEDVSARIERERELAARLSSDDPEVRLRAADLLASTDPLEGADPLSNLLGDADWRVRRTAAAGLARRNTTEAIALALQALREDHRNVSVLSSAIGVLAATEVDVVEPLLELLGGPDPDLRLQAALLLGERADPRAATALIALLADGDDNLRFHAIEALGKLRAAAAVDALARIAESGDFFLAFPALDALGRIGDPSVAPRLAPLMKDELLRGAAADVLGRVGDEEMVVPLTELLGERNAPTEVVAEALARVYDRYDEQYQDGERIAETVRGAITPTGTQNLLDAVQSSSGEQLRSIAKVLGWLEGPAVERALTRLLGQPAVRGKVVEYLVRHGERVVDLLVEQLGAEDLEIRQAAVVGLGRIGDRRSTPALLEVFASDPALGVEVAGALARMGDPRAFEPLLAAVGHPDTATRQAVIGALNSIGHPDMAARVRTLLRDPDPLVRESAVRIAGYFGYRECADELVRCSRDSEPAVRRATVEHLLFLDDARTVPILLETLAAADPLMRRAAAQALARLEDDRAVDPLLAAMADGDAWVRYFAARALGEQRHGAAVDQLTLLAFDDPAGHVQLAAVEALGAIADRAAIPALAVLTASDDAERARAAIRALGAIAHADCWPALEAALRAGDDERRGAAARAMAALDSSAVIDALEWTSATDTSDEVAAAAVESLTAMAAANGTQTEAAIEALVRLVADPARRELVVNAIATLPAERIDDVARRGFQDARPSVRVAILQALARMRRAEASRWIETTLDDEHAEVRTAALTELRHLGTQGMERKLVTLARTDPDPGARRAALTVLRGAPGGAGAGGDPPQSHDLRG